MKKQLLKGILLSGLVWHAGVYDYLSGDVLNLLNCLPTKQAKAAKISERDNGNGTVYVTVYYQDKADWTVEECSALSDSCKVRCPIEEDGSQH